MEDKNYYETCVEDDEDDRNPCLLMADGECSLPRGRPQSVAMGDGDESSSTQHHFRRALRSPTSPTYSLCGARLRWVNITEQLLFGVGTSLHSHSPMHSLSEQLQTTKRRLRYDDELNRREDSNKHRDTYHPSVISFISVAHFPLVESRHDFIPAPIEPRRFEQDRIFASDFNNSSPLSSPPPGEIATREFTFRNSSPRISVHCWDQTKEYFNSSCLSEEKFISTFAMPVPESFCSTWSTQHDPSLHISAAQNKLRKLKELRRDDNHNIEEITESEVPVSRLHAGLRNGNGHLNHHYDDHHGHHVIEQHPENDNEQIVNRQPANAEYTESVSISRIPAHQEYRDGVHYDIDNPRRYREEVRLVPGQTNPGRYYSTLTQCFINSNYRRYTETVFIQLHAPNPKQYSTKVFVFPKSVRETFVSEVDHHDEETIKWYKVGVKMEAKDYVSVKFMQVN